MLVFGTNHEVTDPRFSDKNSQVYHLRGVCCFNSRRRLPVSPQDADTPVALYLLDRRSTFVLPPTLPELGGANTDAIQ